MVVHEIENKVLRKACSLHQELYKDFFIIQSWHSLSDVWRLENQGLDTAYRRVAHIICFYMERYGETTPRGWQFKVPLTQQDLADIIDLSRETVSIAVNELKQAGLLLSRRKIIVPDLDALKKEAYGR